jgi:sulfur carrier protein ThiS
MTVNVEFMGPVRRPWAESRRAVQVGVDATVASLLAELGFRQDETRHLWVAINNDKKPPTHALVDGDHVTIALLVGGG